MSVDHTVYTLNAYVTLETLRVPTASRPRTLRFTRKLLLRDMAIEMELTMRCDLRSDHAGLVSNCGRLWT